MITDQKTQNRLHADTGTELFSIRQRKEAVTRMLHFARNIWKNRGDIESAFHLPIDVRMPLHI